MFPVYHDIGANCAHENKCMVEQINAFDEVRPLQRDQGVSNRTLPLATPRWRKRIMVREGSSTKTYNDRLSLACITTETGLDVFLFRLGGEFDYILCRFPLWLIYARSRPMACYASVRIAQGVSIITANSLESLVYARPTMTYERVFQGRLSLHHTVTVTV